MLEEGDELEYWTALIEFRVVKPPDWLAGYGLYVIEMMTRYPKGGWW